MELKIDLHVHSDASLDGRSGLDELAQAARKRGLDAIAICNHNRFTLTAPEEREGVLLLPGCEFSTKTGHVLALFCKEYVDPTGKLPELSEAVKTIHDLGGIAVIAHPFTRADKDREKEAECLDGAEAANSRAFFHNKRANEMASEFAARHALIKTGGSDAHEAGEVGNSYTAVTCEDRTPEAIENAVRAGRSEAVFVKNTSRTRKGLSQLRAARRRGGAAYFCRELVYTGYCVCRDILHI